MSLGLLERDQAIVRVTPLRCFLVGQIWGAQCAEAESRGPGGHVVFGPVLLPYPLGRSLCTVAAPSAFHGAGLPQPLEGLVKPTEGSPAFSTSPGPQCPNC